MVVIRRFRLKAQRHKVGFTLITCLILIFFSLISSAVLIFLNGYKGLSLEAIIISQLIGLGLAVIPILFLARRFNRPRELLIKNIRKIGEGYLCDLAETNEDKGYSDINESINNASQMLVGKLRSIEINTNRLSAIEKELCSYYRPKNSTDPHEIKLFRQLKITISRLQNDLSEFSLDNKNKSASIKTDIVRTGTIPTRTAKTDKVKTDSGEPVHFSKSV